MVSILTITLSAFIQKRINVSLEEYKPPPEPVIGDPAAPHPVREAPPYAYHPAPVNETVLYPLTRRGSLETTETLSEMEFAHTRMPLQIPSLSHLHTPQSSVFLLRHQYSMASMSPSRPGTPHSAYGIALDYRVPTPPAALHSPLSPPISSRSATPDPSLVSYSTTNSTTLMLAPGSTYPPAPSATSSGKRAEAEKASEYRPKKPATFHADSGVRFRDGDAQIGRAHV